MKIKSALLATLFTLCAAASSQAMMNQPGFGMNGSMGGGMGYGMNGAGGMKTGLLAHTINSVYLDQLAPLSTPQEATTAIQNFVSSAGSNLQISAIWEYQAVYKAELSDTTGEKAFDVLADKLTGVVLPEMGFSMMMNASWGKQLQKTSMFGRNLVLTADQAIAAAQAFVNKNVNVINYTLAAPETYPGYYKFHTTNLTTGKPGVDIMVNGYNGKIWMNSQLGAPLAQVFQAP